MRHSASSFANLRRDKSRCKGTPLSNVWKSGVSFFQALEKEAPLTGRGKRGFLTVRSRTLFFVFLGHDQHEDVASLQARRLLNDCHFGEIRYNSFHQFEAEFAMRVFTAAEHQ